MAVKGRGGIVQRITGTVRLFYSISDSVAVSTAEECRMLVNVRPIRRWHHHGNDCTAKAQEQRRW